MYFSIKSEMSNFMRDMTDSETTPIVTMVKFKKFKQGTKKLKKLNKELIKMNEDYKVFEKARKRNYRRLNHRFKDCEK